MQAKVTCAQKQGQPLRRALAHDTHTHKADAQPAFLFEMGDRSREAYFVEMALASLSSNSANDTRCPTSRSVLAIPQPLPLTLPQSRACDTARAQLQAVEWRWGWSGRRQEALTQARAAAEAVEGVRPASVLWGHLLAAATSSIGGACCAATDCAS